MCPVDWGGVRHGNGFSRVTSSFQTLSAVCCGKLLVFIQYIISIWSRFYGSLVYIFWCLVSFCFYHLEITALWRHILRRFLIARE